VAKKQRRGRKVLRRKKKAKKERKKKTATVKDMPDGVDLLGYPSGNKQNTTG